MFLYLEFSFSNQPAGHQSLICIGTQNMNLNPRLGFIAYGIMTYLMSQMTIGIFSNLDHTWHKTVSCHTLIMIDHNYKLLRGKKLFTSVSRSVFIDLGGF